MADSIPLEVGLPPSFFLQQEGAIDLLLTFSDSSASGAMGMGPISSPICWREWRLAFHLESPPRQPFEMELAERYRIPSYLCDASVEASQLKLMPGLHTFTSQWLGSFTGGNTFTLDAWVAGSTHAEATSLLLQMDIEGAEYNALLAASDSVLSRFRMAVIELHLLPALGSARFLQMKCLPVLRKLLLHFDVVHAHANNCCGTVDLAGWEVPPGD